MTITLFYHIFISFLLYCIDFNGINVLIGSVIIRSLGCTLPAVPQVPQRGADSHCRMSQDSQPDGSHLSAHWQGDGAAAYGRHPATILHRLHSAALSAVPGMHTQHVSQNFLITFQETDQSESALWKTNDKSVHITAKSYNRRTAKHLVLQCIHLLKQDFSIVL